jgi:ATP-dependent helicase HrpA
VGEGGGGALLKKQLLDPHWEKKAARGLALERATLVRPGDLQRPPRAFARSTGAAREIFIREALVAGEWESKLPVPGRQPASWCAQVEELEHKSRRQDVLVDEELIYAFYDQQLPADVATAASPSSLVPPGEPGAAATC